MMGTGDFAVPTLAALIASEHDVVGLVTQPDRTGRGHHHHVNPMKELAVAHEVPVFQPEKVNEEASLNRLREFEADLFVVAAYGQILSAGLLNIPRLGAINLHASLLPKYRGAAPIQYAVLNGETETGVTIFQIEPRLDAGPVLGVVKTPIGPEETSGQLEERLAQLGAPLALQVIQELETGTTRPLVQERALVSKAPKMPKSMGEIDWSKTSREIGWHVRAMQPWPLSYSFLQTPGRPILRLIVLKVCPVPQEELPGSLESLACGQVIPTSPDVVRVRTGDGAVDVQVLQPSGKRAMSAREFQLGYPLTSESRLGPEPA
jgi:methionyl-tRNA formyltransferase